MLATTDAAITQAIFSQFTLEEWLLFSKPLMPFTISHSMLQSWAAVQNPGKKDEYLFMFGYSFYN